MLPGGAASKRHGVPPEASRLAWFSLSLTASLCVSYAAPILQGGAASERHGVPQKARRLRIYHGKAAQVSGLQNALFLRLFTLSEPFINLEVQTLRKAGCKVSPLKAAKRLPLFRFAAALTQASYRISISPSSTRDTSSKTFFPSLGPASHHLTKW